MIREGVADRYPEEGILKGEVKITRFTIDRYQAALENLRARKVWDRVLPGQYVRLEIGRELMMSDTPMERWTNEEVVTRANGVVFIAGLGIGLLLPTLLKKDSVISITVVEKSQDVIDLVAHRFAHEKLTVVQGDIFSWEPVKGAKYDTMYFDIWPEISIDNLDDMYLLERRFRKYVNRQNLEKWVGSWLKKYLQKRKRSQAW